MTGPARPSGADRYNAREAARAPLLAHVGLVPQRTAEEHDAHVRRVEAHRQEAIADLHARFSADVEAAKTRLRAVLGPAAFAALDAHVAATYPEDPAMLADVWRHEMLRHGLRAPPVLPALVEAARYVRAAGRAEGNEQLQLFGMADPSPAPVGREGRGPCLDCGWAPGGGVHPVTCPSLVGIMVGMSVDCAACKALPWGACDEHRGATRACQEAHVPAPSRYVAGGTACQRCGTFLAGAAAA